ncbi:MAG: hypothetical protein UW46_C0005G0048 [Candidatus Yanofskybacteria bacterium GW2011_GWF1_44_227]|uniref:Uncharacterized protein n=1 Tax=Candidatus Yanofskybacteria bacterium GW2011_GWE2_40_11 TaxID=1619033 RepID=A0A0G0QUH1_9BACT|nr:MAG: hypothetical protein UT69_C0018G0009 [Candidatus Yanofskybacteria bacterium GW2011_GWE1_40_10]KKR41011.1 MAG: hypothetical protein UT75_C0002G0048 [Candidatus Yanofskybacteria bacterium GW2011_GWE2_40_11]KKT53242.1 MAG: hypothetical protein UW46_C0005G0048 [Candidatus Yanofskybacteria bacterium GW2011_GWF1_44_227]
MWESESSRPSGGFSVIQNPESPLAEAKYTMGTNLKRITVSLLLVVGVVVLISALSSGEPGKDVETVAAFDVPMLVGKDLSGLVAELGIPDNNSEPNMLQIENGTKTWEKSWERGDYFLMATYDVKTRNVIDLFIGAETDAGFVQFRDTKNILKVGGLSSSATGYSVEFVKARNTPGYTGAVIKER